MSWIPFSFLPDDPELWDIPLESMGAKIPEPSSAARQAPETPSGHQQMSTRSRTPSRGTQHKASARLAQLQPPAAAPNTSCAHQHTPGRCCLKSLSSGFTGALGRLAKSSGRNIPFFWTWLQMLGQWSWKTAFFHPTVLSRNS